MVPDPPQTPLPPLTTIPFGRGLDGRPIRHVVMLRDRSFEVPTNDLEKVVLLEDTLQVGTVAHKLRLADADRRELYGFPGAHAKPYDGVQPGGGDREEEIQKIFPYGDVRARVVMEREETRAVEIEGAGNVRHMVPGFQFVLGRHPDGNGSYVLTRVRHDGENSVFRSDNVSAKYENTLTCLPVDAAYRPARRTRRPVAQGPETAIVVGVQASEQVDAVGADAPGEPGRRDARTTGRRRSSTGTTS